MQQCAAGVYLSRSETQNICLKEGCMTRILGCALVIALLGALAAFGQQPQQNPPAPNAPGGQASPTATPSGGSSQDKAANNSQIQSDLNSVLSGDPALSGTDIQVSVDDMNITLTGSVQSQAQIE